MFSLTRERIEGLAMPSASPQSGATVVFEGTVRDHNEGHAVERLEYESMENLACKEGERILAEALAKFPIDHAECVHRVGALEIGEIAIRVAVSAGHRKEAFAACQYIVDEVKARVPIWKKEHYAGGASEWINSSQL